MVMGRGYKCSFPMTVGRRVFLSFMQLIFSLLDLSDRRCKPLDPDRGTTAFQERSSARSPVEQRYGLCCASYLANVGMQITNPFTQNAESASQTCPLGRPHPRCTGMLLPLCREVRYPV
jgi:hypothetical protein